MGRKGIFGEFGDFMAKHHKEVVLFPLLIILIILSLLIIFGHGRVNVPFVYSGF